MVGTPSSTKLPKAFSDLRFDKSTGKTNMEYPKESVLAEQLQKNTPKSQNSQTASSEDGYPQLACIVFLPWLQSKSAVGLPSAVCNVDEDATVSDLIKEAQHIYCEEHFEALLTESQRSQPFSEETSDAIINDAILELYRTLFLYKDFELHPSNADGTFDDDLPGFHPAAQLAQIGIKTFSMVIVPDSSKKDFEKVVISSPSLKKSSESFASKSFLANACYAEEVLENALTNYKETDASSPITCADSITEFIYSCYGLRDKEHKNCEMAWFRKSLKK